MDNVKNAGWYSDDTGQFDNVTGDNDGGILHKYYMVANIKIIIFSCQKSYIVQE